MRKPPVPAWQPCPRITVESGIGPVMLAFTDAGHVHVSCDAHVNDDKPSVEWRGEGYLPSVHLYAEHDWSPKPGEYVHMTRRSNWSDAPPSYRDGIVRHLSDFVRQYVAEHPDVLARARLADANNHYSETLKAELDLRDELAQARRATRAARRAWLAAGGSD